MALLLNFSARPTLPSGSAFLFSHFALYEQRSLDALIRTTVGWRA